MTQTTLDPGTDPTGPGAEQQARPAVRAAAAPLPRVNLLPAEIRESTRLRAVQAGLAGGVLAATALVGLVALAAAADAETAREELSSARTAAAQVEGQVNELSYVRGVYAEVEAAEAAVTTARATEVPWSRLLNDLSLTIPEGVWIETVTVSPGAAATAGTAATYGSITYTGRGRSHDDVATWLEALAAQPGLTDATFTTSAQDDTGAVPTVTFSSTATVTQEALASGTEG
ncbi:MAG: PilN domain-containing protein [Actinomycetota bacterium]|nr:PilN domain-containing protein [Actinomycetota bacterium]